MEQEKPDSQPIHFDVRLKGKHMKDVLPSILDGMHKNYAQNPNQVFAQWNSVVGQEIAKMAVPILYKDRVLHVKVSNSTLLSILDRQEKPRLLNHLKKVCPQSEIQNILFKIG